MRKITRGNPMTLHVPIKKVPGTVRERRYAKTWT
jgi:hypothetical protein